jgi:hypothetical protein
LLPLTLQVLQSEHLLSSATHSPEPLHFVQPVHFETHVPPLQVWHLSASHVVPQLPQLELSLVGSMHLEEHSLNSALQEEVHIFAAHFPTLFESAGVHSESAQQLGRPLSMQVLPPEHVR